MGTHGRVHREGRAQWVSGEPQRFDRWRALVGTGGEEKRSCSRRLHVGLFRAERWFHDQASTGRLGLRAEREDSVHGGT